MESLRLAEMKLGENINIAQLACVCVPIRQSERGTEPVGA
jgi:hypothetical protein